MHLLLFHSSLYGSLAAALCRPSPAVIFSKRSMGLQISWIRRVIYKHIIISRANAVTAVSPPVANECVRLGIPADRVQVVQNGIEWIDERQTGLLRKALGVPPDVTLVGAVGSMTPRKRHHLILQAAPLVLARRPDVHFVILGEGPLRRDLVELRQMLGLNDRFHFPGVLAPATRYLADLSAFVLPSSEEGTSNALLEAMMIGVPCVASDIPSNREVITHGATGLLVDVARPEVFAEAVVRVLDNGRASAELVVRAREHVGRNHRLDVPIGVNASLYRSFASGSRSLSTQQ
jgi:glycosyltransferase involved in cell wall biosynthesis